jgi:hypothetical protein
MSRNTATRRAARTAVPVLVAGLAVLASVTAAAGAAGETAVGLSSPTAEVAPGETTTFDVVVRDASGGVGAYTANVTIANPEVASIASVEVRGDPGRRNVSVAPGGASVRIEAVLMDTSDTGSVTIATVTVEGETAGTSAVSLALPELGDEEGTAYAVTDASDATLEVRASGGSGGAGGAGSAGSAASADDGERADGDDSTGAASTTERAAIADESATDDESNDADAGPADAGTSDEAGASDADPTEAGGPSADDGALPGLPMGVLLVGGLALLGAGLVALRRR